MLVANLFDKLRLKNGHDDIDDTNDVSQKISDLEKSTLNYHEMTRKAMNGKELAYQEPFLELMDTNPDFRDKRSYTKNEHNLHEVLRKFGSNEILNAIIITRQNQVTMFCRPARYSEDGVGFEVALRDPEETPGKKEKEEIKRIEAFIEKTGTNRDLDRDTFQQFCKKLVRDTYIYDQVNFEKVFSKKTNKLQKFVAVDPTTIFYATDSEGRLIKGGHRFVQVIDKMVRNKFTSREMAMGIRNPRTDITASGYGFSEVEIAMREFIAYNNTTAFNDRFFSHGGTTRGVLQIKTSQQQSQQALENFKREWKSSLSGINGSWQIPVMNADDVKFINMTPTANDMQFKEWLNFLINIVSSLYGIDPAEIGFPNKGGATGGKAGNTLNESDPSKKTQQSKNKGLQPLLRFIEDMINTHIIAEFNDKYVFRFTGGDTTSELEKLKVLEIKAKNGMTGNEFREAIGLKGKVPGGDIPLNGVAIQREGQLMQQKQFEYTQQKERYQLMQEALNSNNDNGNDNESNQPSKQDRESVTEGDPQDKQQGFNGKGRSVNGKTDNQSDGQVKEDKAGYSKEGFKESDKDWS